ncbi:hypothetical protein DPSP01_014089 [Paraphaeosphaeria sporulosa]
MPLKVIVVGAGLGGLATTIALTRAGHDVEVFERSSFTYEVGAAINLAPNATRVLTALGCDLEAMAPVRCEHLSIWNKQGEFVATAAVSVAMSKPNCELRIKQSKVTEKLQKQLGFDDEWLLVHRVDIHNALRKTAEAGFSGRKPKIYLSCGVTSVDPINGKVVLSDGRQLQADLVIGADGVHSRTVHAVADEPHKKIGTGQNCYRFLVPTAKLQSSLLAKSLVERIGLKGVNAFRSQTEKIIIYPCRSGALINSGVFLPTSDDEEIGESSWLNSGQHSDLVAAVKSYSPELREFCRLGEDVKLWSLATRDPPQSFFKEKLALIGDAAHPMLPHQGQGGAQAFEDAAALGALLTADTTREQVTERLRMYNDVRYEHAVTVMFLSRVGDELQEVVMDDLRRFVPNAKMPEDMFRYAWASYPTQDAERILASSSNRQRPLGGYAGERQ